MLSPLLMLFPWQVKSSLGFLIASSYDNSRCEVDVIMRDNVYGVYCALCSPHPYDAVQTWQVWLFPKPLIIQVTN